MQIVVNTPAGNIGRVVTAQLLAAGHRVTVISRHPQKLQAFVEQGARLVAGSIDDPAVLDQAFQGADALFWLPPLVFDQPDFLNWARTTGRLAATTAQRHGITRAVLISSVGAQHESGVGPIGCMPAIEGAFRECVPHVTALRAAHFMENFLAHLPTIATQGAIYSPHPTDKKLPLVASRDIADAAVRALQDTSWMGFRIVGVHGPVDLDHATAARIIGDAIGKPVRHVEVPVAATVDAMTQAGMPPHIAALIGELYRGIRDGRVVRAEPRSTETTTPTTLHAFAQSVLMPALAAFEAAQSKTA